MLDPARLGAARGMKLGGWVGVTIGYTTQHRLPNSAPWRRHGETKNKKNSGVDFWHLFKSAPFAPRSSYGLNSYTILFPSSRTTFLKKNNPLIPIYSTARGVRSQGSETAIFATFNFSLNWSYLANRLSKLDEKKTKMISVQCPIQFCIALTRTLSYFNNIATQPPQVTLFEADPSNIIVVFSPTRRQTKNPYSTIVAHIKSFRMVYYMSCF